MNTQPTLRLALADFVHAMRLRRVTRDRVFHQMQRIFSESMAAPGEVPEAHIDAMESLSVILAARHGFKPGTVKFLLLIDRPKLPFKGVFRALSWGLLAPFLKNMA